MISAYLIHRQPPRLSSRVLSTNLSVHRPLAELPPSVAGAREPRCCLRIVVLALSLVGASRPPSDSLPPREDRQVVVRRRSSRSAVRAGRGAWVISISAAEESVIHTSSIPSFSGVLSNKRIKRGRKSFRKESKPAD